MLKKSFFGKRLASGFQDIQYSCVVNFLDSREPLTVTFQKETLGRQLLDHVCSSLDLAEKDYFGLRYVDKDKQRHWLDPKKAAYRQLKGAVPMILCFRVKYYPSDPFRLKEELTRYFLFLQLERDLLHGRLLCSQDELTTLTGYLLQAKLGDYDERMTKEELIKSNLLPKGADLDKITSFYKKIRCLPVVTAEESFVKEASKLDTYGVDPHSVKDIDGNAMYVGLSYPGIKTFQGNKKANCFSWGDISRLDFEGKNFIIHASNRDAKFADRKRKQVHSFKCPSTSACKHLWKCAVEQQCFFTLDSGEFAPKVRGNKRLFRRPSTFKFSGLSESEIWLSTTSLNREEPVVQRSVSNPQFFRNCHGYETLPASFKIGAYQLASGESLESSSSSSLMIASKANVNSSNSEEVAQKSPSGNSKDNPLPVEIEEEKVTRNNLEQVLEDDVEEMTEDVKCEEPISQVESSSLPVVDDLDVPAEKVLENELLEPSESFKNCDSSFFPPLEANSEFFDLVEEERRNVLPLSQDLQKTSNKKNMLVYLIVASSLFSALVYFVGPDEIYLLSSYPGKAVNVFRDILCQIGF